MSVIQVLHCCLHLLSMLRLSSYLAACASAGSRPITPLCQSLLMSLSTGQWVSGYLWRAMGCPATPRSTTGGRRREVQFTTSESSARVKRHRANRVKWSRSTPDQVEFENFNSYRHFLQADNVWSARMAWGYKPLLVKDETFSGVQNFKILVLRCWIAHWSLKILGWE